GKGAGVGPAPFGLSLSFDHFVLPRMLRRPARLLTRLGGGEFTAPPFSAAILSAVLIASSSAYGAYLGGQVDGVVQGITARTGFAVDQIKVVGNHETSEIDILDRLELDGWTSLIGFDAEAARERIRTLPWVEVAAVRKVYPHTLEVRVEEREPFALWQQGDSLSVIERDGQVIAPFSGGKQALLPLINDGGRIINISSGLARFAAPGSSAYAMMKGGIEVFTRYLAKELGARGIAANTVAPGAIATDFNGGHVRDNAEINRMVAGVTALGRTGVADDIGPMIASLLSQDNRWVNAQRIEVSGGMNI
ncbi:MAG: FtsQ-type POTRA domain-containing protein, partial [Mesorhizobium sp.]